VHIPTCWHRTQGLPPTELGPCTYTNTTTGTSSPFLDSTGAPVPSLSHTPGFHCWPTTAVIIVPRRQFGHLNYCRLLISTRGGLQCHSIPAAQTNLSTMQMLTQGTCYSPQIVPACSGNGDVQLPFGTAVYVGLRALVFAMLVFLELFG